MSRFISLVMVCVVMTVSVYADGTIIMINIPCGKKDNYPDRIPAINFRDTDDCIISD